ncbi:hypothetical protein M6D93_03910 [Jatrophihabitans telluris]|uniref:Uncharacterized protein n=1 Tax=Jatrophihabitans telluris TaxID=2038343 RepID=A0ABY4R286_9ACTN|nr:hypothetical protein [Jatrophihabitans telluris]UQX89154.1 hypothetical protein M6D93_03910 [Jatrophihabitans telluris]
MTSERGHGPRASHRFADDLPPVRWGTLPGKAEESELARLRRLAEHAANLTRLSRRIEILRAGADKRIGGRLRAALTAYDQTLLLAGLEAGIESRLVAPLRPSDRMGLEAELSLLGLRW